MRVGLVLVLCVIFLDVDAQSFYAIRNERSLILLAGTGTSTYFGELTNDGDYLDAKPNLDIGLQYFLSNRFSVRAEAIWFQLQGDDSKADDKWRTQRNLSFKSNNFEVGLTGSVNILSNGRRFYQRPGFNVYGFAGLSLLFFNPVTEYQGTKYALRPLQTELNSYSRFVPVIPMGLGLRFKVNPLFNLSIEGGFRKTFTDYVDDVSTVHPGAAAFSDPIAAALSDRRPELGVEAKAAGVKRGNPATKDAYFLLNAKVEFYLPTNFLTGNSGNRKLYTKKRKAYNSKARKIRRR